MGGDRTNLEGILENSLTSGFDDVKDAKLGLVGCGIGQPPHYRHRATLQKLCGEIPDLCGKELANSLYDCLLENWSKRSPQNNPSRQFVLEYPSSCQKQIHFSKSH